MSTINLGNLEIDNEKITIHHYPNDSTFKLTPREAILLGILARNKEKPLLINDIVSQLWNNPDSLYIKVFQVFLTRISKHLRRDNEFVLVCNKTHILLTSDTSIGQLA